MKILHISVTNKVAKYRALDGDIVCGNSGYKIEFAFDNEWDAFPTKTARFVWNGAFTDVVFTGDTCDVPIITNATLCEVGVFAGELVTTTPAKIGCVKSILCGGGVPAPPSDDVYSQIMQRLNQVSPAVTTQLIPVFIFDRSRDIQDRLYDIETHVLLGWEFEDDNVEERTHKGITEDNWFIPCYTSQNAYTHFYICNNIPSGMSVVLRYKDGGFSEPEYLGDGWDAYIELSTDIDYIAIVGEW